MVTEYIKRGYRKGFDEKGNIVYKVPATEEASQIEETPADLFDLGDE